MPATLIEVRRAYTAEQETALIDAVLGALGAAFQLPAQDRTARLVVHEPHRFACSPKHTQPERFTLISIDAFAGRSLDAKRALYRGIVEALEPLGIPRDHVKILLRELPRENWGLRGGHAASDLDLGFKIDV